MIRKWFMHWLWHGKPVKKPLWFGVVVSRLACLIFGHEPTADHCGRPEHDHCLWCMRSMPGRAHHRTSGGVR